MKRALVTGAGGFCGQHLTRYLEEQGIAVHTLSRAAVSCTRYQVIDPGDVSVLSAVMRDVRPDYVFHLAGVAVAEDPSVFYRVNTLYAASLLQALAQTGYDTCPVLLVGTAAEYGMITETQLPIAENCPPHPYNDYGISKLAQTLLGLAVARCNRPIVIVRPFNILGPGMPGYLVAQSFASQMARILDGTAPPVIHVGNLQSSRDFIDVADVVEIYWRLVQAPQAYGEIVNVCSGRPIVIGDMLTQMVKVAGISVEIRPEPTRFKSLDIPVHYGSPDKLQRMLGTVPSTTLEVSLRRLLASTTRNPFSPAPHKT